MGNEYGEILNCVLKTGEGAGLEDLCQGIVQRYRDAAEPEPDVIYVDRDCCSGSGECCIMQLHVKFLQLQSCNRVTGRDQNFNTFLQKKYLLTKKYTFYETI